MLEVFVLELNKERRQKLRRLRRAGCYKHTKCKRDAASAIDEALGWHYR